MQDIILAAKTSAAQVLVERRQKRVTGARLNADVRPNSLEEAIALQEEVSKQMCADGADSIGGWKCLLPPDGKLIVGPIYSSTITRGGSCNIIPLDEQAAIEPEFAFVFGQTLPPRDEPYSAKEVLDAVANVHFAFELIKSRYDQPSECEFPELLADGLFNQGLYIGPKVATVPPANCALTLTVEGQEQSIDGEHPNKDPFGPVVWLVNFLSKRGLSVEAGQGVITGSYAGVLYVPFEQSVKVQYADLGAIETVFKPIGKE